MFEVAIHKGEEVSKLGLLGCSDKSETTAKAMTYDQHVEKGYFIKFKQKY